MELTERQATMIATTIHEIRGDWGIPSLMTILWDHREQPSFGALLIAAATKALDPTCKTPAPIFHPGTHWPEEVRDTLPQGPRCEDHDTFAAHNCPSCRADILAGDRPASRAGKHHTPTEENQP